MVIEGSSIKLKLKEGKVGKDQFLNEDDEDLQSLKASIRAEGLNPNNYDVYKKNDKGEWISTNPGKVEGKGNKSEGEPQGKDVSNLLVDKLEKIFRVLDERLPKIASVEKKKEPPKGIDEKMETAIKRELDDLDKQASGSNK